MKTEKTEEQVVRAYLEGTYPDAIVEYEPDGEVPPDFLFCGSVAIEVRRLNENYITDKDKAIGLEQDLIKLKKKLEGACEEVVKQGDKQYYLEAEIIGERPLDLSWISKKSLTEMYMQATSDLFTIEKLGVRLEWKRRIGEARSEAVVVYSYMDHHAGGWTAEVYSNNIQVVIDDKWTKCKKNAARIYEEWWLVLVDYIFPASDFLRRYDIQPSLRGFTRVVVLDQHGRELHVYGPPCRS
jgi:hypothetical protein